MPYLDVTGWCTDYEVTGEGEPVVLLHGGLCGADVWAGQVPALVEAGFRVWTPERRGHGHSPDTGGPFTLWAVAPEVAALAVFLAVPPVAAALSCVRRPRSAGRSPASPSRPSCSPTRRTSRCSAGAT